MDIHQNAKITIDKPQFLLDTSDLGLGTFGSMLPKVVVSEHVYMRPEVNSNRFEISNRSEMSFRLHGSLHGDFTAATFQTIARPYCTCANDIF